MVERKSFQLIHARIIPHHGDDWMFTLVYASPDSKRKSELWKDLIDMGNTMGKAWLVAGDFNDIRGPYEKKGEAPFNWYRANLFNERIHQCQLSELDMQGGRFTWKGPESAGYEPLYEKLDRVLRSVDWRLKFPEANARILTRVFSDHHPILIAFRNKALDREKRPFCFKSARLTHDNFQTFLQGEWKDNISVIENLNAFQDNLKDWNVNVFGNIGKRKRRLLARLNGIQRSLNRRNNPFLLQLERQEELMWQQKSRAEWIINGERNTIFSCQDNHKEE